MSIFKQLRMAGVGFALLLSYSAPSLAHSTFPSDMESQLGMSCLPACTICHKDNLGGFGTINKPFGKAMQENGLLFVPASLPGALQALEAAGTDSDGDGVGDVTELREGQDPNGDSDLCSVQAVYGCGAHIASRPPEPDALAPLASLLTALVLGASLHRNLRRRRSKAEGPQKGARSES